MCYLGEVAAVNQKIVRAASPAAALVHDPGGRYAPLVLYPTDIMSHPAAHILRTYYQSITPHTTFLARHLFYT